MGYNPHYSAGELGLELYSLDEPEMSYEFNTLDFWATKDGRVFSASDSGCSCPTPFEDYEGATQDEVLQKLEQVGSVRQALEIFDAWNKGYEGNAFMAPGDRNGLEGWVRKKLEPASKIPFGGVGDRDLLLW